jgi:hypothetical protein
VIQYCQISCFAILMLAAAVEWPGMLEIQLKGAALLQTMQTHPSDPPSGPDSRRAPPL